MDAASLNDCFIAAMTERSRYAVDGIVEDSRGVVTAFTNLGIPSSYQLFRDAAPTVDEFETRLASSAARGRRAGVPWSLSVLAEWVDAPRAALLASHGFRRHGRAYGMYADALAPRRRPEPAVDLARVATDDDFSALCAVNSAVYGVDAAAARPMYAHYLHVPGSNAIVGHVDGHAVACAAAYPMPHGVYLGAVATLDAYRGRGFGEAVSRRALEQTMAESGLGRAILFAGPAQSHFYAPLGFTRAAELWFYRLEDSAAVAGQHES